jgi:hypothetical protein
MVILLGGKPTLHNLFSYFFFPPPELLLIDLIVGFADAGGGDFGGGSFLSDMALP